MQLVFSTAFCYHGGVRFWSLLCYQVNSNLDFVLVKKNQKTTNKDVTVETYVLDCSVRCGDKDVSLTCGALSYLRQVTGGTWVKSEPQVRQIPRARYM